jgi:hypothetical protein
MKVTEQISISLKPQNDNVDNWAMGNIRKNKKTSYSDSLATLS